MKRRNFVNISTSSLVLLPFLGFAKYNQKPIQKPDWLLEWIKINDKSLEYYNSVKITDPKNENFGGYFNDAEIANTQTTSGFLNRACCLISCPESIHYQSSSLFLDIEKASIFMLKMQHADGTIDYLDTNFHSTPDTAFVLENIIPAYTFLSKLKTLDTENVLTNLKLFLQKAGLALVAGGIHTPNHRWVVAAALSKLNDLFPHARYTVRIEQWLAEHIDIDPDGQYTEKSTNTYSPIVNRCLIAISKHLNKPYLLDYVRKNLRMTLYYMHPNGEIVTEASNRQDKGTIDNMAKYYYCYKYFAITDKDSQMAAMCRRIEATSTTAQLAGYLDYFLEDEKLWSQLPSASELPINYVKAFPYSGVVRIRRYNWDCTILAKNPNFLTFHKVNTALQGIRLASSFFGKGQFETNTIEQQEGGWVLRQSLEGPYYQPISNEKIDPNGDWSLMPRGDRVQTEIQKLESTIIIKEIESGIEIEISVNGTDHVPLGIELIFRAGGKFEGVEKYAKKENTFLLSGNGQYKVGNETINFGPGIINHKGIALRGALPAMNLPTVFLTGFTPFKHILKLT